MWAAAALLSDVSIVYPVQRINRKNKNFLGFQTKNLPAKERQADALRKKPLKNREKGRILMSIEGLSPDWPDPET